MKLEAKIYSALLALLLMIFSCNAAFSDVEINSVNFPDDNFRSYIINELGADLNHDGSLSDSEIAWVISMDVTKRKISSLSGIEYFSALEELYCYANNIALLDVSRNSALYMLECDNNKLTRLDLSKNENLLNVECQLNNLTELDLGGNKELIYVKCYGQTRDNMKITSDDDGGYLLDLSDYVNDLGRVANLAAYDESGDVINNAEFDSESGLVHSLTYPAKIKYSYKIDYAGDPDLVMDVTITGVVKKNKSVSDNNSFSGGSSGGGCNSMSSVFSVLAVLFMFKSLACDSSQRR